MNILDKCASYIQNIDINDFVYRFYNTSKVQDDYILDKINLLRYDLLSFWLGLDHESKEQFIKVIETYDKNKKYKVKFPRNMVTIIDNGKIMLVLR